MNRSTHSKVEAGSFFRVAPACDIYLFRNCSCDVTGPPTARQTSLRSTKTSAEAGRFWGSDVAIQSTGLRVEWRGGRSSEDGANNKTVWGASGLYKEARGGGGGHTMAGIPLYNILRITSSLYRRRTYACT